MAIDKEKRKISHQKWLDANKERLKEYRKQHYKDNREVYIERVKKWTEENPEYRRNNLLKSTYGITLDDYNKMFNDQNGSCKTCFIHQSELKNPLFVDHCHTTGKIRGLLCYKCNSALGFANDDIQVLNNLIEYLKDSINDKRTLTVKNKTAT